MTISRIERQTPKASKKTMLRPRLATLVMLGVVGLAAGICAAWFAGEGTIQRIFVQLNLLQKYPPVWLEAPMVTGHYLLAPTVFLFLLALVIMRLSPQPRHLSRTIVVGILLILTVRYVVWRSLATLNLSNPANGVFSLSLFFLEMVMLTNSALALFLMLRVRDRHQEANVQSIAVLEGAFTPMVDVLIPTYDEPEFILRRTVIGCQAMDYVNKRIYLLDDTRRPEICKLAADLGCEYMTRPDNQYAKAGNLNHAIAHTEAELIVVFDADFVPTRNFLTRTVGFFQDEQVALVQTPQSFYNSDPIARNLGLEDVLTSDEEVFYRQIQPIRDAAGSVICAGTSFLVRRSALEATGGFVTDSISEDYFTGIRLSAQGYKLIYLDEKLSAGLAADNMAAYATQRLRWAQGTLQAFFIDSNPLTIRGLTPLQRLAHLEGLLSWFTSIPRVGFLLAPLAYSFLGVIPMRVTAAELVYFFLPYYVMNLSVFSWLNFRSRSALLSDVYSLVLAIPIACTVAKVMLNPFSKGFQVTPKGMASDRYSFNWSLGLPLIGLFIATAISFWRNLGMWIIAGGWAAAPLNHAEVVEQTESLKGLGIGWLWSGYNLIMLGIVLLILLDVPRPHLHEWFALRRTVRLSLPLCQPASSTLAEWWGITTMLSETGAEISLTQAGLPMLEPGEQIPVKLYLLEENLVLEGTASWLRVEGEFPTIRVKFEQMTLEQQRKLIEMLFCRPGQWKRRNTPGELQSLWLIFRTLLRPRVLFEQSREIRAIAVAQG